MERASSIHGCGGTGPAHRSSEPLQLLVVHVARLRHPLLRQRQRLAGAALRRRRLLGLPLAPSPPPSTRLLASSAAPGGEPPPGRRGSLPLAVAGALACASMATSLRDGRRAKAKLLPAFVSPGTPRLRPRGSEGREAIA